MTFEEMAKARYSVKKYSSRPVEEEKLQKILAVANLAPTAKNAQCVRIYVLQSPAAIEKAKILTPCTYGAPVVLLFAYDENEAYRYPGVPMKQTPQGTEKGNTAEKADAGKEGAGKAGIEEGNITEKAEAKKEENADDVGNSGPEDCSIVATHVMFEALEQGLGTCWVNRFTPSEAKKLLGLPQNEHVVLLMDLGYPAEGNKPLPNHEHKKPLEDIVRRL